MDLVAENCPTCGSNESNGSIESLSICEETLEHDQLGGISLNVFPIRKGNSST